MKRNIIILAALTAALAPSAAWSATDATSAAPAPFVVPADVKLSPPARDVVKMVASGVSDDVVKAYVANASSTFNLSADNIIHMQGVGVSASVTSAMLNHDKSVRDQMAATPPPGSPLQPQPAPYPGSPYPAEEQAPAVQPANTVSVYTIPPNTAAYYSDLEPYGSWSFLANYGWCWQPRIGLGYYPWGILSCGNWWNCPGHGWVWFPRSGFRGTAGVFGGRGFVGGGRGFVGGRGGFATGRTGFGGERGHFGGGSFAVNRSIGASHFSSSVHVTTIGGSHSFGGGGFGHSSGGGSFGRSSGGGGFGHSSGGGGRSGGHR